MKKSILLLITIVGIFSSSNLYSQNIRANTTGYTGHIYHLNNYNVGIGLNSPEKPLNIYRYNAGSPSIRFHQSRYIQDIGSDIHLRWDIAPEDNLLKFKFGENTTTTIDQVTIDASHVFGPKVGIGMSNPSSNIDILDNSAGGSGIKLTSQRDASILLYADSDNNTGSGESDNSYILFSQDGLPESSTKSIIGLVGTSGYSPYGNLYNGTISNYAFFGANQGICFGTDGTITEGTVRMWILDNGMITVNGEGVFPYRLAVWGSCLASGGIWQNSDLRFKKNIKTISDALKRILMIRGTSYAYNTDKFRKREFPEGRQYGFIAQEIREEFPEMVNEDDSTGYLALNYDALLPLITEAIKEQQDLIDNQQMQLDSLNDAISSTHCQGFEAEVASCVKAMNNSKEKRILFELNIPEGSGSSDLLIFDNRGKLLQSYNVANDGKSKVEHAYGAFGNDKYIYTLVIDGKEISTKNIVIK